MIDHLIIVCYHHLGDHHDHPCPSHSPLLQAKWEEMIDVLVNEGKAACLFNTKGDLPDAGGDEADYTVQKWLAEAEKIGKDARKNQKSQRMEAARQAFNAKQEEYQNSCSDVMVAVMDSSVSDGYKGAQHL